MTDPREQAQQIVTLFVTEVARSVQRDDQPAMDPSPLIDSLAAAIDVARDPSTDKAQRLADALRALGVDV